MKKKFFALALALSMVFAAAGCTESTSGGRYTGGDFEGDPIIRPETALDREGILDWVNAKGFVTGRDAKVNTVPYGIYGTDLGIPFYSPSQERMYFCFGDTYAGDGFSWPWNSNALLYTDDLNFAGGIDWDGAVSGLSTLGNYGRANLQITPDVLLESNYPDIVTKAYHPGTEMNRDEGAVVDTSTCIPTGAIELDGNMYVFYMEVTEWNFGPTGQWCIHSNRVMKSTDGGKTFAQLPSLKWDYDFAPNFGQIFPLEVGDYVYLYGLKGGRCSSLKAARVKKENFEDMSEYEYLVRYEADGAPVFVKGKEGLELILIDKNEAGSVILAPCGEMSIAYNDYLGMYVAIYQMGAEIVLRVAKEPYGPFDGTPYTVFNNGEFGITEAYCAFTHNLMTSNEGQRIYFMLSSWFPVYNVQLMELVLK